MVGSDRVQHVTGLNYFAKDTLRFPLFQVKNLNDPNGANIIYTDSIPLIAPLARAYHKATGELLDYFRLWILVCCIMQGVAAAILLRVTGIRSTAGRIRARPAHQTHRSNSRLASSAV